MMPNLAPLELVLGSSPSLALTKLSFLDFTTPASQMNSLPALGTDSGARSCVVFVQFVE